MNLSKNTLRTLSLSALLAVFSGLAAAPAAAGNQCVVPKERAQQLIQLNRQHRFEKGQNARHIENLEAWCQRHWRERSTPQYGRAQARIKSLKVRQGWLDHFIHQNKAEYYGWQGGYIMNGGSAGSTNSTTSTTAGGGLLNQTPNKQRPPITPPRNTSKSGTSGGGNTGSIDLLDKRAKQVGSRR